MKMKKTDEIVTTLKVDIKISWQTAVKLRIIGRYPASIIAKAIAEKIKAS